MADGAQVEVAEVVVVEDLGRAGLFKDLVSRRIPGGGGRGGGQVLARVLEWDDIGAAGGGAPAGYSHPGALAFPRIGCKNLQKE